MSRNKLYIILLAACILGYIWLTFTYLQGNSHFAEPGICMFKRVTTLPCPSCGSTRSVLSLIRGDIAGALYWNPLGFLLITIMVVVPFWISFDVMRRKDTLFNTYLKTERLLVRKWLAIPAILLVIINWIWNINKGL